MAKMVKKKKKKIYGPPPALIKPIGNGYMPFFSALLWIATQGFQVKLKKQYDKKAWTGAYQQLVNAVASEKVKAMGRRGSDSEIIPAALFASCQIVRLWDGYNQIRAESGEMYLRGGFYANPVQWIDHSDQLVVGDKIIWNRIVVQRSDVGREWPYQLAKTANRNRPDDRPAHDSASADSEAIGPASLLVQFHPGGSTGKILGLMDLQPAATKLLLVFQQAYVRDEKAGKALENCTCLSAEELAEELKCGLVTVRKAISSLRAQVSEAYDSKYGIEPSKEILIENCPTGSGYRINPYTRFVAYPRSQPAAVSHARSQTAVTNSKKSQ
jgi:hypothetical protein